MKKTLSMLCLGLMMIHIKALAASPIAPFRAVYSSAWNDLVSITAQATQELTSTPEGNYQFSFTVNHALLKLNETSTFTWQQPTITSQQYHYQQIAMGISRTRDAFFDWTALTASNPKASKPWSVPISADTLDRLNYQLQLRADIKAGKKDLSYHIVDNGKIKTYAFKVGAHEKLKTPLGVIDTVKVERVRKSTDDRQTTFWVAPQWDYLLVKFKQTEQGKLYEINLSEAVVNGKPIK